MCVMTFDCSWSYPQAENIRQSVAGTPLGFLIVGALLITNCVNKEINRQAHCDHLIICAKGFFHDGETSELDIVSFDFFGIVTYVRY